MDSIVKQNMDGSNAILEQEANDRLERLMDEIVTGRVATRIMEVASLAVSRHLFETAQAMKSAVEAENSTL